MTQTFTVANAVLSMNFSSSYSSSAGSLPALSNFVFNADTFTDNSGTRLFNTIVLTVGSSSSITFSSSNNVGSLSLFMVSGTIPSGMNFSGNSLIGTPTTQGVYSSSVRLSDSNSVQSLSRSLNIVVVFPTSSSYITINSTPVINYSDHNVLASPQTISYDLTIPPPYVRMMIDTNDWSNPSGGFIPATFSGNGGFQYTLTMVGGTGTLDIHWGISNLLSSAYIHMLFIDENYNAMYTGQLSVN